MLTLNSCIKEKKLDNYISLNLKVINPECFDMFPPFKMQSHVAQTYLKLSKQPKLDLTNSCIFCLLFPKFWDYRDTLSHGFYNSGDQIQGFCAWQARPLSSMTGMPYALLFLRLCITPPTSASQMLGFHACAIISRFVDNLT